MKNILTAILFVLICQAAGLIGAGLTVNSISSWYVTLNKPWFNPPNWLFGPTWTLLYTLMGIGVYLIWKKSKKNEMAKKGVKVFFIHLLLNALWSPGFFGIKQTCLALIIIVAIWTMIVWLIKIWGKVSKTASWLLVPYLAWVSFATILNFAIWRLN